MEEFIDDSNLTPEQRLVAAIAKISKFNGKLEIKFLSSDNGPDEKVCLVFIKIPLPQTIEDDVRTTISGYEEVPLSVGRLTIEVGEHITVLTGIIRVKSVMKLGNVVYGLVDRLLTIINSAHKNTKYSGEYNASNKGNC